MTKAQGIDLKAAQEAVAGLGKAYVDRAEQVLDPSKIGENLLDRMPSPTGWRLLILPYRGKGKTEGGIYLPDKIVEEN